MNNATPCLLAIDTLSPHLCVSLYWQGQTHSLTETTQKHANTITEALTHLLTQAQCDRCNIDFVVVNHGPGSFTSLRVGLAYSQALAHALNIPIILVENSRLLAYAHIQNLTQTSAPMMFATLDDAKLSQVYFATYSLKEKTLRNIQPDGLFDYRHIPLPDTSQLIITCGPDWEILRSKLTPQWQALVNAKQQSLHPIHSKSRSEILIEMAINPEQSGIKSPVPAGDCQPNYVRHRVAEVPKNKKA